MCIRDRQREAVYDFYKSWEKKLEIEKLMSFLSRCRKIDRVVAVSYTHLSNYKPGLKMNHIYFTANVTGAGLAAALAKGKGSERVYIVEPTGEFENDPNVTDKKFPGNLTRSYRSQEPLKIIGEETEWTKPTATKRREWHENLAKNKGDIIN